MADDGYVCPNGHAVAPARVHNCPTCRASVVYEPAARGMAFRVRAEKAEADLDAAVRLLNDAQTTIIDTDLRRKWEAGRARLRAVVGQ